MDVTLSDAAATDAGGGDATLDVLAPTPEASPDGSPIDAASQVDAGPTCAPPSDATKAALCVIVSPEAIRFISSDPSFDGKGVLAVDVHDTSNPSGPDGGPMPALQGTTFPSADSGGGEIDLASPLPFVRFDGLPAGLIYPRVIFIDSRDTQKVGAGWWLGGYDLEGGLKSANELRPVSLQAGTATTVTIGLTALRAFSVTLTRSAAPTGNAQGPAFVVVTPDELPGDASALFGIATAPCANLAAADAAAAVNGFVLGPGPYYSAAVLDDFANDASLSLPPGALTSLAFVDGGLTNSPAARLQYAASAYAVVQTLDLDLGLPFPDAGADLVTCP